MIFPFNILALVLSQSHAAVSNNDLQFAIRAFILLLLFLFLNKGATIIKRYLPRRLAQWCHLLGKRQIGILASMASDSHHSLMQNALFYTLCVVYCGCSFSPGPTLHNLHHTNEKIPHCSNKMKSGFYKRENRPFCFCLTEKNEGLVIYIKSFFYLFIGKKGSISGSFHLLLVNFSGSRKLLSLPSPQPTKIKPFERQQL